MGRILPRYRTMVLKHNKNFLCIIIGATGSGKSFCALKIASKLDPNFDIDKVVFTAGEFMSLVNRKLRKGTAIVWDELGAGGMTARNWYTAANKAISNVMQTFRKDNLFVIFTVPSISFIDINVRKLIHVIVETTGKIDYDKCQVITKFFEVQHNPRLGKTYQKYPRIKVNGIRKTIKRFRVGMPPQRLIDKYELKKEKFTKFLNQEALSEVLKIESKEMSKTFNVLEAIEELKVSHGLDNKLSADKIQAYYFSKGITISAHLSRRINALWKIEIDRDVNQGNKKHAQGGAYIKLLNSPKTAKNHKNIPLDNNTTILPNTKELPKKIKEASLNANKD